MILPVQTKQQHHKQLSGDARRLFINEENEMLILKFICLAIFIMFTIGEINRLVARNSIGALGPVLQAVSAAGFITLQWLM